MKIIHLAKNEFFYLFLIILVSFAVRLYKIDNPVADWHSWRQADTAAVARTFYKEGYNPFIPRYDDMSAVAENPVPNLSRYRFVEFPIYTSLVYFGYVLNGGVDERIARLTAIFFSLGSLVLVYFITKKYFGKFSAFVASFLFGILPFNIYFSRVILPEPSLVFFGLGMFYFADLWIEKKTPRLFLVSLAFTILAFLTKPMAIFYFLPLIYVYFKKEQQRWPIRKEYIVWMILGFAPFLMWRIWMSQFPEGIPASKWLFNGNGIRFRPAFWKWIVGERLGSEILGAAGFGLFIIGFLIRPLLKESWILHLLAASSILFLIVFATGNIQHDYYQTLIIPALVIFAARGFVLLCSRGNVFVPRIFTIPVACLLFILTIYLPWLEVSGLYQVNNWAIVRAGKKADSILPKDAVVIAPYMGDTAFLYQINRRGWPFVAMKIEDDLIRKFGAQYYISTAKDAKTKWVMDNYSVMYDTSEFVIIDLQKRSKVYNPGNDPEP